MAFFSPDWEKADGTWLFTAKYRLLFPLFINPVNRSTFRKLSISLSLA